MALVLVACGDDGGGDATTAGASQADGGDEPAPEDTVEQVEVDEVRTTDDGWPSEAISVTEPFGAGGLLDLSSRFMGAVVGPLMGVQAVNLNQPGAANEVAAQSVLGQPRDGQHIFATSVDSFNFMASVLSDETDPDDFVPLGAHGLLVQGLIVHSDTPWESAEDFVAAAEAGDEITMAVTLASANHAMSLIFQELYAPNLTIVPFDGGSDQRSAVAGGVVDAMFTPIGGYPAIQEQTRLLAAMADENPDPDPDIRDAPAWSDIFDDDMQYVSMPMIWMVPAEVADEHPERLELLREVYAEAAQSEEYLEAMRETGAEGSVLYYTPEEVEEITVEYLEIAERFRDEFTQ